MENILNNLKEGQKFIHWDMDFLPHFSVKIVRVTRVWTNHMGFDAEVTYVTDYLLYNEKKSWRIADCPVLVPLSQKTYDAMFLVTWKAMRRVQQILLNARQAIPYNPDKDTCFVLANSLTHVRFGRIALGVSWDGKFERFRRGWYIYERYVADTFYMGPSELSHDRSVFTCHSLVNDSLYYVSTKTFLRVKHIYEGALSQVKDMLTQKYKPMEENK